MVSISIKQEKTKAELRGIKFIKEEVKYGNRFKMSLEEIRKNVKKVEYEIKIDTNTCVTIIFRNKN